MSASFRNAVREALSTQLFGGLNNPDGSYPWRVLILDSTTLRVLSSAMRMSELQSKGISLVENLELEREPLLSEAIYFISPTEQSVKRLAEDNEKALYTGCHVFFSSTVGQHVISTIKGNRNLVKRLRTLKEASLEVSVLDAQCFLTDQPNALHTFYQAQAESASQSYRVEMETALSRLLTVFLTLNERPAIRYFMPQKPSATMGHRALICEQFAKQLESRVANLSLAEFPKAPTCDCLILDRAMDAVAPVIHEWTYEAMVYDLLSMDGNIYKRSDGSVGTDEVVLDEEDNLWKELRHMHIAEASSVVNDKLDAFKKQNAAARNQGSGTSSMSTTEMKNLIQLLPQYRDVVSNMALHIDITRNLFHVTSERKLKELGELEQDLVYGEKHSRDIITFLSEGPNFDTQDKMRLFMCYLATHPDKLDADRRLQWQRLAGLNANEMETMLNLEHLGISVTKKEGASLLSFIRKNKSKGIRKNKVSDQYSQQYALEKFQPELYEIIEKLCSGELPEETYPYTSGAPSASGGSSTPAGSVRTNYAWTKKKKDSAETAKSRGKRVIVFVLGGMSRSEMRVMHKLASTVQRDLILGSTSVETPTTFIHKLGTLGSYLDEYAVRINVDGGGSSR